MKTTFSQLDAFAQLFIARFVANELQMKEQQWVASTDLLEIFDAYDVDVDIAEDLTMRIECNEKLTGAVKLIVLLFRSGENEMDW